MLDRLSNYIDNKDFKITLYDDKLHILNYERLLSLEENYISVIANHKKISVKGNKLFLRKILDNELLIAGKIKNIEVADE